MTNKQTYVKEHSIFVTPETFLLRLYNTETHNQRAMNFKLFESFMNYKNSGILIVDEINLDEFVSNEEHSSLLSKLYVREYSGTLKHYESNKIVDESEINNPKLILKDTVNSNFYEITINDGVLEVNIQ